jgi:hypothetical protein
MVMHILIKFNVRTYRVVKCRFCVRSFEGHIYVHSYRVDLKLGGDYTTGWTTEE